jgi:CTP synthase (UTP-ammonia lyase)
VIVQRIYAPERPPDPDAQGIPSAGHHLPALTSMTTNGGEGRNAGPERTRSERNMESLRILLVGDHDERVTAHRANEAALRLSAEQAGCRVQGDWPGTEAIARDPGMVHTCDGVWCVPASPYRNTGGALDAIRIARERCIPFLGTCGGFQHALLEYARNVLGMTEADHEELSPEAESPLISRLSCSLVEVQGHIRIEPDSLAAARIGESRIVEEYHCNFGLEPGREVLFQNSGLRFTGHDAANGEPRIAELRDHPFFMVTLFQPERAALRGQAHPLITAFMRAALDYHQRRVQAIEAEANRPVSTQSRAIG